MRNTPMVLRHKSFKINPYKKRRESIEETRNFLHNIFELTWIIGEQKCLRGKDRGAELSLS